MILIKVWKDIIQIENEKYWMYLMIRLLICLLINKREPIVTDFTITEIKPNISLVFMIQSYFAVTENIRPN